MNVFLQSFHKSAHVITIADRMVDLDGQRQEALTVPLEEFSHSENWKQKLSLIEDIDVKAGELQPGVQFLRISRDTAVVVLPIFLAISDKVFLA